MKPRLKGVKLTRASHGWLASLSYSIPTQRRFTPEEWAFSNIADSDGLRGVHFVPEKSRSLLVTLWRMYWYSLDCISLIQSIPGDFPENVPFHYRQDDRQKIL